MWVRAKHGHVPPGAVLSGRDTDGGPIYAARAQRGGELLPANLIPSKRCAVTCTGWNAHDEHEYEVLCNERAAWIATSAGQPIPHRAIPIGHRDNGRETLYLGRVLHGGALIPGKVHSASMNSKLHIPFAGRELPFDSFEILISVG